MNIVKREFTTRNRKKKDDDTQSSINDSELVLQAIDSNTPINLPKQTRNKLIKNLENGNLNCRINSSEARLTTFGQFACNFFVDIKLGKLKFYLKYFSNCF